MKFNYKKIFIPVTALFIITLFALSFNWFPFGYTGTTKKGGEGLGCVCHGLQVNTPSVSVNIIGPDSVAAGQTVNFRVSVSHGPAITGGFDLASYLDTNSLYPVAGDTMVKRQDWELTHTHPKPFSNDTVSWIINYTAPNAPGMDTLYATGNSTNNNNEADTSDQWNWSLNKTVRIYNPIGIINLSTIASDYSLSQNFPNPFNPVTQIDFSVARTSDIKIRIYDILGNEIAVPVAQTMKPGKYRVDFNGSNLSSGTYFYSLTADGKTISTKKMLLIK
ncbi:MAG: T9SS type A sorting domain-containing protein [Ignavibacteria bacterium]|nr:T9SS type A sorting domain-containing protein [Ignavibacteria bacterium]